MPRFTQATTARIFQLLNKHIFHILISLSSLRGAAAVRFSGTTFQIPKMSYIWQLYWYHISCIVLKFLCEIPKNKQAMDH